MNTNKIASIIEGILKIKDSIQVCVYGGRDYSYCPFCKKEDDTYFDHENNMDLIEHEQNCPYVLSKEILNTLEDIQ